MLVIVQIAQFEIFISPKLQSILSLEQRVLKFIVNTFNLFKLDDIVAVVAEYLMVYVRRNTHELKDLSLLMNSSRMLNYSKYLNLGVKSFPMNKNRSTFSWSLRYRKDL